MLVKLKAPPNSGPITRGHQTYHVTDDGWIEVPTEYVEGLVSHGFSPWADSPQTEDPSAAPGPITDFFSTLNRNACFRWAANHGLKISTPITALAAQQACRAHAKAHQLANPPGADALKSNEPDGRAPPDVEPPPVVDPDIDPAAVQPTPVA